MPTIVNSWNEWDPLTHVIVGLTDDCHIPPEEPALDAKVPEDSDCYYVGCKRSPMSVFSFNYACKFQPFFWCEGQYIQSFHILGT